MNGSMIRLKVCRPQVPLQSLRFIDEAFLWPLSPSIGDWDFGVKSMFLHHVSSQLSGQSIGTVFQRPGFESRWRYMFFTSIKVASSWRTPLQVAPEGVLT